MKPVYAHAAAALGLTFATAACVPAPDSTPAPETMENPAATPTPVPAPTPSPTPVVTVPRYENFLDAPRTPGRWTYLTGQATYLSPAGEDLTQIECTEDGDIFLSAQNQSFDAGSLVIRTETMVKALSADAGEGSIRTVLAPGDPILDAIALTRGRFTIEVEGRAPLYLPAWAEVTRVIEDCR